MSNPNMESQIKELLKLRRMQCSPFSYNRPPAADASIPQQEASLFTVRFSGYHPEICRTAAGSGIRS